MNIQFGTGVLFMLPNAGDTATNPTPYKLGALQSAEINFKSTLKKMFGQKQFPLAKARGQVDVSGKAKLKSYDPGLINQLYFGQAMATGQTILADDEAGTIPSATTYTVTVANSADFATDYGVRDGATGAQLTKVLTGPAAGQYSVSAGVYTFAAADAGKAVKISYTYTSTVATAATITLNNELMGYAPEFRALLSNVFRGKRFAIELYNCTMGGITVPTKQDDFWECDIDFEACTDDSDTLGAIYADLS